MRVAKHERMMRFDHPWYACSHEFDVFFAECRGVLKFWVRKNACLREVGRVCAYRRRTGFSPPHDLLVVSSYQQIWWRFGFFQSEPVQNCTNVAGWVSNWVTALFLLVLSIILFAVRARSCLPSFRHERMAAQSQRLFLRAAMLKGNSKRQEGRKSYVLVGEG